VGDGTFTPAADVPVGDIPSAIVIGDLTGDGRLDLAVANGATISTTVSIRLGRGDGTFDPAADVSVGHGPFSLAIGHLNGDGKPALAIANFGTTPGTVSIRLGSGTGTFTNGADVRVGNGPNGVVVGDLNGDGKLDVAAVNLNDNTVSVRLGTGSGAFVDA